MDTDRQELVDFSFTLEEKLDFFVNTRVRYFLAEQDRALLLDYLIPAWNKTKKRFSALRKHLKKIEKTKLRSVGLTGAELNLKIYLYNTALKELEVEEGKFQRIIREIENIPRRAKNAGKWLRDHWQQLFEYANVILDSLSSVGVVGADAIGEVKTALEKIIIWRRDRKSKNQ